VVESGWEGEKRLGYRDAIAIYLPTPTDVATITAITTYLFYPNLTTYPIRNYATLRYSAY
jgi:hypothetical protein